MSDVSAAVKLRMFPNRMQNCAAGTSHGGVLYTGVLSGRELMLLAAMLYLQALYVYSQMLVSEKRESNPFVLFISSLQDHGP